MWSFADVIALLALVLAGAGVLIDAARAILHFTASRTASTWDDRAAASLDRLHDRIAAIETRLPPAPSAAAPPSTATMVLLLAMLGVLVAAQPGCGGTTSTRAATISSLQAGIQTASAGLRSYEHERTEAIIEAATDRTSGKTAVKAFRVKVDKVWIAVDVARAAIDAANTINDDASISGAQTALANAITAITALTGSTAP